MYGTPYCGRARPESVVDLHPSGFFESQSRAISGGQQVGSGRLTYGDPYWQALLWSGTAESYILLHPPGSTTSFAAGISGGQQVGSVNYHAALWSGTAESFVDLHTTGFSSCAWGVYGGQQVGSSGGPYPGDPSRALLWSGTAESCVHLHPSGFDYSEATGIWEGQQVGSGWNFGWSDDSHALLWQGTAESVVDLHPSGFTSSHATGVSGFQQVGWADGHAALWSGTAESFIDLHSFLPPECTGSLAYGIDSAGNIVGLAYTSPSHWPPYAVLWQPSEPTAIEAAVDIDPDILNLKSTGSWITCYIELPEGYDVSDIDVGSMLLLLDAEVIEVQRSDVQDGVLMIKFDRQDMIWYIKDVLESV